MSESNGGGGNLTGFLMGALVGVVVGAGVSLLLAPRSGKDTRRWLGTRTREIKNKTTNALQQGREAIRREGKTTAPAGGHEPLSYNGSGASRVRS